MILQVEEEWKTIDLYPAYQVSNKGRFRTIARTIIKHHYGKEFHIDLESIILHTYINKTSKYEYVSIANKTKLVHSFVANAFVDKPEDTTKVYEVNHKDFIRSHNESSNLERLTHKENTIHSSKAGRLSIIHTVKPGRLIHMHSLKNEENDTI